MDGFLKEIQEYDLAPLWKIYEDIVLAEPGRAEPSVIWKWQEMLPLIEKSAQLVHGSDADHRVLILKNPNLDSKLATTTNILANFQCVNPGEQTSPHRHTPAATRVILEGAGGGTFVDGKRCDMYEGDLIITPNWTWHCHKNDSDVRAIWLDVLDIPLVGSLDAVFSDMKMGPQNNFPNNAAMISDDAYGAAGLLPATELPQTNHSPRLRYAFDDVLVAAKNAPVSEDGSRLINYTNPVDGSGILPTHDAKMCVLARKKETAKTRSTSNAVCVVLKGIGKSQIGDVLHEWEPRDVFTIPHWSWTTHTSFSDESLIIKISDRQVLEKLNLFREEVADK